MKKRGFGTEEGEPVGGKKKKKTYEEKCSDHGPLG